MHRIIDADQGQPVLKCLCHEDAIERVAVQRKQPGEVNEGKFIES